MQVVTNEKTFWVEVNVDIPCSKCTKFVIATAIVAVVVVVIVSHETNRTHVLYTVQRVQ